MHQSLGGRVSLDKWRATWNRHERVNKGTLQDELQSVVLFLSGLVTKNQTWIEGHSSKVKTKTRLKIAIFPQDKTWNCKSHTTNFYQPRRRIISHAMCGLITWKVVEVMCNRKKKTCGIYRYREIRDSPTGPTVLTGRESAKCKQKSFTWVVSIPWILCEGIPL